MILLKNISNIILFPDSGDDILEELQLITAELPTVFQTDSMQAAVKFAYENTPPHTVCLLSTASPSYSLWKNFEEKGDQFQQYVITYGKN
jgi:UDP-N-acetylmuramoyl-L-alanine---L-glutamate ligase